MADREHGFTDRVPVRSATRPGVPLAAAHAGDKSSSHHIVKVRDLDVRFSTLDGPVLAVDKVSFDIKKGEVLGLVGESGSGKSVTGKSLMHLNDTNASYGKSSTVTLHDNANQTDVLSLKSDRDLAQIRGAIVSMVFQEPLASFAPALTIGQQMVEQLQHHKRLTNAEAKEQAIRMLQRVGISDAQVRLSQYAFEYSGGMLQRAMIAMALSTNPRLLIADEPTTSLDVTIQAQVIELFEELITELEMSVLLISHDLGVVARLADRIAVMYCGSIVEIGTARDVIKSPLHPYTKGLLKAYPRIDKLEEPLTPIPGDIPSPHERPLGCVFCNRCELAVTGMCDTQVPEQIQIDTNRQVACHLVARDAIET